MFYVPLGLGLREFLLGGSIVYAKVKLILRKDRVRYQPPPAYVNINIDTIQTSCFQGVLLCLAPLMPNCEHGCADFARCVHLLAMGLKLYINNEGEQWGKITGLYKSKG